MNEHWTAFADHVEAVRRYARAIGRDPAHADDLAQECLARALSRPRDWKDVRDARAYLLTILHNLHVDDVVRRWRDGVTVPIADADPARLRARTVRTAVAARSRPLPASAA